MHSPGDFVEVVLLIPSVSSEGARRKTLSSNTDYADALSVIYATIGCASVQKKPHLGYKFSSAAQKTQPIDLSSDDDWTGMLEDLHALQKKKKMVISVNLSVGPEAVSSFHFVCLTQSFSASIAVHGIPSESFEEREGQSVI